MRRRCCMTLLWGIPLQHCNTRTCQLGDKEISKRAASPFLFLVCRCLRASDLSLFLLAIWEGDFIIIIKESYIRAMYLGFLSDLLICWFVILICCYFAVPNLFEGDIVRTRSLDIDLANMEYAAKHKISKFDAIRNGAWSRGVIPYAFDRSFSKYS